jgi:hypothetical protein
MMNKIKENSATSLLASLKEYQSSLFIALSVMPKWERAVHIWWLFGPFLLLIERSPADIWLSITAISFLVWSTAKRDFSWLRVFWVKCCFLFLFTCILSSLFSAMPLFSFLEAIAWFRFPLFAMAVSFWLGKDRRLLYAMMLSTALGVAVMTGILALELILEGTKGGRLMWPYGDKVPGNYLSKVGLPAFVVTIALAVGAKPRLASWAALLSLVSVMMSIMTGERINFLLRACAGMLAGLVWRVRWRRIIILLFVEVTAVLIIFSVNTGLYTRFSTDVLTSLPTGSHSEYYRVMSSGILLFESEPVFGAGPATYRELCPFILDSDTDLRCDNHPHNFYIQLLAEVGVIGFLAGSLMIVSIIWAAAQGWVRNRSNVVASTAFIIPLAFFFPLQSTADFFGQWNNVFMWSAIALSLASARIGTYEDSKLLG